MRKVTFTQMNYGPVYILDVAGGNTSANKTWDVFKVYASISEGKFRNLSMFVCCFMYGSENKTAFIEETPLCVRHHASPCYMRAFHFTCPNRDHSLGIFPKGVGLTITSIPCKSQNVVYRSPFYPKREPGTKLAIGTKIAFGNISAELIIEWMEAYKSLEVDKVVTYYIRDINKPALAVLNYYAATDFLDLYLFEPAAADLYPRVFHPTNRQKWNDARMVIYDSFEKMSGYTYFGIIDHDEFLVPSRNRSLKQMLDDLFRVHDGATGFTFKTQFYYLSWGKSGSGNDSILGAYITRKNIPPKLDKEKSIYKPQLVSPGGVSTHIIEPRNNMIVVPAEEGYIRHYRECRPAQLNICMHTYGRVTDNEMADWFLRIQENVRKTRQRIFGSGLI